VTAVAAMTTLYTAWAGTAAPPPGTAPHLVSSCDWPPHLHMRFLDCNGQLVRVSFYLGRLRVLSRCELAVARWASEGHSNAAIAALRQTSMHTVARQMSSVISKLGLGSRLGLATLAELNAWAPPCPTMSANENGASDSWLKADGIRVEPQEMARIWREIASEQWSPLASLDLGAVSYVAMRRASSKEVQWARLTEKERGVVDLMAQGFAQKVVAMKLGLAPSSVSSLFRSAHKRLGFRAPFQLLRAYCASKHVIDISTRAERIPAQQATIAGPRASGVGGSALIESAGCGDAGTSSSSPTGAFRCNARPSARRHEKELETKYTDLRIPRGADGPTSTRGLR
jgi:DNA-binding NarL/FixJ family response regulator